jgi:mannitol-1-/sugar-/sorbitol-6-phosphatase
VANVNRVLWGRQLAHPVRYHEQMLLSARALLFDLDGVLVDSTPVITRIWEKWAVEHGFEPEKTAREAHGRPSLESIRELLPNSDYETLNRDLEQREIDDTEGVVPLPGIVKLLASLPPERWTVVTSCTLPLAMARLEAAALEAPPRMITSSDISNGKPHPEPYLKGANALGFEAADCIAFEDAPAGVRSAKAAGARVVALRSTDSDEALLAAGADWIWNDFTRVSASVDASSGLLQLVTD